MTAAILALDLGKYKGVACTCRLFAAELVRRTGRTLAAVCQQRGVLKGPDAQRRR
jgi:hypothetical protein